MMDRTRRNNYENLTANSSTAINFEVVSLFPAFNRWLANVDGLNSEPLTGLELVRSNRLEWWLESWNKSP